VRKDPALFIVSFLTPQLIMSMPTAKPWVELDKLVQEVSRTHQFMQRAHFADEIVQLKLAKSDRGTYFVYLSGS
jgi:hypothetical protein